MVPDRHPVEHSPKEVAGRALAAREAQVQWGRYTLTQRVRAVRGFWRLLSAEKERLLSVIEEDTGKPRVEAEVMEFCSVELIVRYFTRNAHRILQDRAVSKPWILFNKRAYVRYLPRGLIGLITPWNFPFLIPFGDAIPALLAGNGVLLKPSEWTTRTALFLEDRFNASGLFPEGLLQVAVGGGPVGEEVVRQTDMVLFTGSISTGRKVASAAAERLIPAVLELGGLHSMIVAEDAPLERAAKAAVWGRFANSGQVCIGVERVFVDSSVYERFCEALLKLVHALRGEPDAQGETDLGRLIFPGQLEVVERHLRDAREKGGRVIGGEVLDRQGLRIAPAVVLDAHPGMEVMREETFGPVLAVMPVRRVQDALKIANEGRYGLASSVWTRDLAAGEEWAARLESGMVSVNDLLCHYVVCSLPFGGMKESGLGRRHSEDGLRMFCQPQSVIVHEWPANLPEFWWFPYQRVKARLLSWLTRLT